MNEYKPKKFTLSTLDGISEKTIEEHLKLYEGYVKNLNTIHEKIEEYRKDSEKHAYALGEIQRRFAFEFDGMRNHEYYFSSFEGGSSPLPEDSSLAQALEIFGGFDSWFERFKAIAKTRGVGWAMLGYDREEDKLLNYWVDEQHLGHLTGVQPIVALDMWEHSYLFDYTPGEKAQYIDVFFKNLNWEKPATWYDQAKAK